MRIMDLRGDGALPLLRIDVGTDTEYRVRAQIESRIPASVGLVPSWHVREVLLFGNPFASRRGNVGRALSLAMIDAIGGQIVGQIEDGSWRSHE
jgi:hypothetical protein